MRRLKAGPLATDCLAMMLRLVLTLYGLDGQARAILDVPRFAVRPCDALYFAG